MRNVARVVALCGLSVACLHAGFVPIGISGNTTFTTFPGSPGILLNGNLFPAGPQTFNGVPFNIGGVWSADAAAGGLVDQGQESITIPINVWGVGTVYTLINTEWSQTGGTYASLIFTFADGSTYTVGLDANSAIRDYNNSTWQNTVSSAWSAPLGLTNSTMEAWNDSGMSCPTATGGTCSVATGQYQRLDQQVIHLPTVALNLTLQSMTLVDTGNHATAADALNPTPNDAQRSFISGLTVVGTPIPEPGTMALLFGGIVAMLALRKRAA